jgi:hypothetical protein
MGREIEIWAGASTSDANRVRTELFVGKTDGTSKLDS